MDYQSEAKQPETVTVETATVACDGGPSGHPKVFLQIGQDRRIVCPYCSRTFVLKNDAPVPEGH